MTGVIAKMLLDRMDEMGTDVVHYRAQRITRWYVRHVIYKANCYSDNFNAMRYARRVVPLEGRIK